MQRYSQNDEQDIIASYFKDQFGTFLDIGANDGITLSNTYALTERGWKGSLVDASPKAFSRLQESYRGKDGYDLLNYAIGSYNGVITLHESGELLGKGDTALVSSTREDEVRRWDSLNMPFTDVEVPIITFDELLKNTSYTTYDLLSVDIEGMEKEVVPQIDFNALKTKMAIIEWNGKDADFYDNIMREWGFKLTHTNAENRIYCK